MDKFKLVQCYTFDFETISFYEGSRVYYNYPTNGDPGSGREDHYNEDGQRSGNKHG